MKLLKMYVCLKALFRDMKLVMLPLFENRWRKNSHELAKTAVKRELLCIKADVLTTKHQFYNLPSFYEVFEMFHFPLSLQSPSKHIIWKTAVITKSEKKSNKITR